MDRVVEIAKRTFGWLLLAFSLGLLYGVLTEDHSAVIGPTGTAGMATVLIGLAFIGLMIGLGKASHI